jgi:hypothetical protein
MPKPRVIITADDEPFTQSECTCDFCISMHEAQEAWETYEVKTHLQRRMKNVVNRIEGKMLKNEKSKNEILN